MASAAGGLSFLPAEMVLTRNFSGAKDDGSNMDS